MLLGAVYHILGGYLIVYTNSNLNLYTGACTSSSVNRKKRNCELPNTVHTKESSFPSRDLLTGRPKIPRSPSSSVLHYFRRMRQEAVDVVRMMTVSRHEMQLTIGYRRTTLARLCVSTPLAFGTLSTPTYTLLYTAIDVRETSGNRLSRLLQGQEHEGLLHFQRTRNCPSIGLVLTVIREGSDTLKEQRQDVKTSS
jgi:hypothetical protein